MRRLFRSQTVFITLFCLLLGGFGTDIAFAQEGQNADRASERRRAQEQQQRREQERKFALDRAHKISQDNKQKKAEQQAKQKRASREERLNEIAYVYAQLAYGLPNDVELISRPYPLEYAVYGGVKKRYDRDSDVAGGVALKLNIRKASANPWDKGVVAKTISDIAEGDLLCLSFWARAGRAKGNPVEASFSNMGVQQSSEPYTAIFQQSVSLGEDWQHFAFQFKSAESLRAEQAQVFFQIGEKKQKIELGPAYLFNLHQLDTTVATNSRACRA